MGSDFDPFRDTRCVLQLDPEATHGAIDLRMTKQKPNSPVCTCLAVILGGPGATKAMRPVCNWFGTCCGDPVTNEPSILARCNMGAIVEAARKQNLHARHLGRLDLGANRFSRVFSEFKLNSPLCLALDD